MLSCQQVNHHIRLKRCFAFLGKVFKLRHAPSQYISRPRVTVRTEGDSTELWSTEQGSVLNLAPLERGNCALTSKTTPPTHTHTDQDLSEQERGPGGESELGGSAKTNPRFFPTPPEVNTRNLLAVWSPELARARTESAAAPGAQATFSPKAMPAAAICGICLLRSRG